MPTVKFRTTVRNSQERSNEALLAVGKYLGYADQTDTFGQRGKIVETHTQLDDQKWYITVEWVAPVSRKIELESINVEMEQLAHVVEHECISNPMIQ